jgi:DNA-binding transcriptional ArsR family regulator
MDETRSLAALTALSQPTRLAAFRHLVAAHPDGMLAGDIARRCKVPHNTMSTHLATLARAGLVSVRRDGRTVNCLANLEGFRALITFLTRDCCAGHPEICAPLIADMAAPCLAPACPPARNREKSHV